MEILPGYTEDDIFSIIPNTMLKFATMPGSSWPLALSKGTGRMVQEELRIIGDVKSFALKLMKLRVTWNCSPSCLRFTDLCHHTQALSVLGIDPRSSGRLSKPS